ncbi:MAG: hypothetical protein QW273_01080 [Candidatus Pacearchaeota archaeon]
MNISLDMKSMMYLNIFEKITRVKAKKCFFYNNILFFVVEKGDVSKAIGKDGLISQKVIKVLKKRIKILPKPETKKEIEDFIKKVIEPIVVDKLNLYLLFKLNAQNKFFVNKFNRKISSLLIY